MYENGFAFDPQEYEYRPPTEDEAREAARRLLGPLPPRPRPEKAVSRFYRLFNEQPPQRIVIRGQKWPRQMAAELVIGQKLSIVQAAQRIGVNEKSVRRWLNEMTAQADDGGGWHSWNTRWSRAMMRPQHIARHSPKAYLAVLAGLTDNQRQVYDDYFMQGLTGGQIANERGLRPSAVNRTIQRIVDAFKRAQLPEPTHERRGRRRRIISLSALNQQTVSAATRNGSMQVADRRPVGKFNRMIGMKTSRQGGDDEEAARSTMVQNAVECAPRRR